MFLDSNLPKNVWGAAVRCAVCQINRCPTKALNGKIPADIYLGKLNLHKYKNFGSKSWYCRLPKPSKLEPRTVEARIVDYAENGCRLWDPAINQVVISRYVAFDD